MNNGLKAFEKFSLNRCFLFEFKIYVDVIFHMVNPFKRQLKAETGFYIMLGFKVSIILVQNIFSVWNKHFWKRESYSISHKFRYDLLFPTGYARYFPPVMLESFKI